LAVIHRGDQYLPDQAFLSISANSSGSARVVLGRVE